MIKAKMTVFPAPVGSARRIRRSPSAQPSSDAVIAAIW